MPVAAIDRPDVRVPLGARREPIAAAAVRVSFTGNVRVVAVAPDVERRERARLPARDVADQLLVGLDRAAVGARR